MVSSSFGTSRCLEVVKKQCHNVSTAVVCNTRVTYLRATIVKNTNYLERGTVHCQTKTLCLDLGTVDLRGPQEIKIRIQLVMSNANALTVINAGSHITCALSALFTMVQIQRYVPGFWWA